MGTSTLNASVALHKSDSDWPCMRLELGVHLFGIVCKGERHQRLDSQYIECHFSSASRTNRSVLSVAPNESYTSSKK